MIGPGSDKKTKQIKPTSKEGPNIHILRLSQTKYSEHLNRLSTWLSVTSFIQRKQLNTDELLINFMERVEMMTMTRTISSSFLQQRLPPSLRCTVPRQFGWKYTRVAPLFICRLSHLRSFLFSTLYSPFLTVVFEYFPTDSYCTLVQRLRIYGLPCHYTIL